MRLFFFIGIILVIIGSVFVVARWTQHTVPTELQQIDLGSDIKSVARILYHPQDQSLILSVREHNDQRSLWKRTKQDTMERILAHNTLDGDVFVNQNREGILFAWFNNPAKLYRSENHGETWQFVADGLVFWTITEGDDGTLYAPLWEQNTATLYRSVDGGKSWQLWKDFQKLFPEHAVPYTKDDPRYKLRHLHDVIAHHGTILVGTGDVARFTFRSEDGGVTWEKIWTEGPTAHTFLTDTQVLLGPDQSRGRGFALYDFNTDKLEEVWDPSRAGYASYSYNMITVDGIAYAGIHNEPNSHADIQPRYGVVVSPDGKTWYPLITRGPVRNSDYTGVYLVAAPNAIYMSLDGTLYTLPPITREWFKDRMEIDKLEY